ncbi:MAG: methylated-DNA--[protein]-cysteine S-methyltransferase [Ginsengibacter sp.]
MFYQSPIGILKIEAIDGYISEINFIDEVKTQKNSGDNEIHNSSDSVVLEECGKQLDGYFAGKRKTFEIPLKQKGTLFQETVWNELAKIPYGKTVSYLHVAKMIGNPKSIRAVGTTNGRNNIAIVIPCHRVIGSDGSLTGYAGGLWRKKWLLDHENKFGNGVVSLFK